MNGDDSAPMVNGRLLVAGGILTAVGGVLGLAGAALAGGALVSAFRQWVQSEQTAARMANAKLAARAGAEAWRQGMRGEVRLSDVDLREQRRSQMPAS